MTNANTKILDSTVDRAAMLRLYEQRLTRETAAIAAEHNSRVRQIIINGKKIPKLLEDEALRYAREGFLHSKKNFLRLAADQLSYTYQSMEATIGAIWRTQKPRIVAAELVLDRPIFSEKTLEGFWGDLSLANKRRIEQAIRNGVAEGLTMEQIALQVRGLGKMSMNQSKAITITAMTSVVAQADREVYRANSKALRGYQYVAILDDRTTDICAARDGHIYDIEDTAHLPPAHYRCRSKTVPVFRSWEDLAQLEGAAEVRRRNLEKLTEEQKAYYDGMTPLRESYSDWLRRQPLLIQRKHLGDKADLFNRGQLPLSKFIGEGRELSLAQLRASGYQLDGDTVKFARAKQKLDELKLPYATPDDITDVNALAEYFTLQAGDLEGNLSLTNYRGIQPHVKKATKRRVIEAPPREDQVRFNPVSGRYEDSRFYQPNFAVHANVRRLAEELPARDRDLLFQLDRKLEQRMSLNERTVVMDNMRNLIGRYRKNPQAWGNFKALSNSQMKFDLMNISDSIESQLRSGVDPLKKLLDANYIDPVLGRIQLQQIHDGFASNIMAKNKWEDTVAPKIAKELRTVFDRHLLVRHPIIWERLDDKKMRQFYLRFANRLALADTPDLDALSVQLGRELYQQAAINGDRYKWYALGKSILEAPGAKKFYKLETFGVQKRRMRSRMSGQYFGPYYDTQVWNIQITDKRIREYSQLTRKVDLGLRVAVTDEKSRLWFRPGYKTYFLKTKLGYYDTRIPITSTSSFSDFPTALVDKPLTDALNWAAGAKYKVDGDFYDFIEKLLYFEDDKGKAKYYNGLNEFRHYFASRSDTYERMKAMEWLRRGDKSFSNHPFIDHRVRIYDRGLVSPQGGESFKLDALQSNLY